MLSRSISLTRGGISQVLLQKNYGKGVEISQVFACTGKHSFVLAERIILYWRIPSIYTARLAVVGNSQGVLQKNYGKWAEIRLCLFGDRSTPLSLQKGLEGTHIRTLPGQPLRPHDSC